MSTFPTSIPSYLGFTATHTLAADTHAAQHNQEQADIIALATKVGTGSSTPASGLVLTASGLGTSSWSQVNLTTMVSGTLPVANGGTGTTTSTGSGSVVLGTSPTIATPTISNPTITGATIANLTSVLGLIYPVGCIYTETTGTNPATTFGFGTWTAFGAGRVPVGVGNNGTTNYPTGGVTGGQETTNHAFMAPGINSSAAQDTGITYLNSAKGDIDTFLTGGNSSSTSRNTTVRSVGGTVRSDGTSATEVSFYSYTAPNLQPYITVFMWKRTA